MLPRLHADPHLRRPLAATSRRPMRLNNPWLLVSRRALCHGLKWGFERGLAGPGAATDIIWSMRSFSPNSWRSSFGSSCRMWMADSEAPHRFDGPSSTCAPRWLSQPALRDARGLHLPPQLCIVVEPSAEAEHRAQREGSPDGAATDSGASPKPPRAHHRLLVASARPPSCARAARSRPSQPWALGHS